MEFRDNNNFFSVLDVDSTEYVLPAKTMKMHVNNDTQSDKIEENIIETEIDNTLETEEMEMYDEMFNMFEKYISSYTSEITELKITDTPLYYIGVAMLCEIIAKLVEIKEKNSVFGKTIVKGLYEVANYDVNVIQIIYNFLELCTEYHDADFGKTTFGSTYGRVSKEKFDVNYNLTYKECDCKIGTKNNFLVLFKTFRTLIGRIIMKSTGSYAIPSKENSDKWVYHVKKLNDHIKCQSHKFNTFLEKLIDIYIQLEKLPSNLSCIKNVFIDAKNKSLEEFEKRKTLTNNWQKIGKKKFKYYCNSLQPSCDDNFINVSYKKKS